MRKRWTPVVAALFLVMIPGPAKAGGAVLQFDSDFYVPGDVVRASSSVWLKSSQGRLADGPYFAYLYKPSADFPPPVPAGAVRVGQVEVVPRPGGEHGDASLEFVLPDLESGRYELTLCNAGCKEYLGDIIPSEVIVAADTVEGRIVTATERLSTRLQGLRILVSNRVLGHRADSLRGRITAVERDLDSLVAEVERLNAAAERAAEHSHDTRSSSLPPLFALLVPAALLGVVAGRRFLRHP